jgi:hypothetical protein
VTSASDAAGTGEATSVKVTLAATRAGAPRP